jgi:hypothetical protein
LAWNVAFGLAAVLWSFWRVPPKRVQKVSPLLSKRADRLPWLGSSRE